MAQETVQHGNTQEHKSKSLFRDINADDDDPEVTEMESLCVNCEDQGTTRLFLTKIPFFQEVIVSSFNCDHCGFHNSELQPAGRIGERGIHYNVKVLSIKDLNRQVVQTMYATVSIPELQFESPPNKGCLTTIEGVIDRAVDGLGQDQVLRRIQHPVEAQQIDQFIEKLKNLKTLDTPFHLEVDDPSGNSFIENTMAPQKDPQVQTTHYRRTAEQREVIGLNPDEEEAEPESEPFNLKDEVVTFPGNCPSCNSPCETNMKLVDIPHFKEVLLMASNCDSCGFRDSEVKGGGGIEPLGKKITLRLTDLSDLTRDVLKGEMASLSIPELEFTNTLSSGSGKFTTLEGILEDLIQQMERFNPFVSGDSSTQTRKDKVISFSRELKKIKNGERFDVHIVLDDPTGNSYIQNLYAPDPDPELTIETYERTEEQNDDIGITHMNTENYQST